MILKFLLISLLSISLFANDNSSDKSWSAEFEASIYLPQISGTIDNSNKSDFHDDFGYDDATASYFSLDLTLDYDYVPNLYISYFNMQESNNAIMTQSVTVAQSTYDTNSSLSTTIDFQVFDAILYQDFKLKGKQFSLFGSSLYSGDIEIDLGIDTKVVAWKYQVENLTTPTDSDSWIKVNSILFLPYAGIKYYLYDLTLYANGSALSVSSTKATAFQAGLDYRLFSGLSLSASYLYNQFEAQEEEDTVNFTTNGYKFGLKYTF